MIFGRRNTLYGYPLYGGYPLGWAYPTVAYPAYGTYCAGTVHGGCW